jgi:hypothetical protein
MVPYGPRQVGSALPELLVLLLWLLILLLWLLVLLLKLLLLLLLVLLLLLGGLDLATPVGRTTQMGSGYGPNHVVVILDNAHKRDRGPDIVLIRSGGVHHDTSRLWAVPSPGRITFGDKPIVSDCTLDIRHGEGLAVKLHGPTVCLKVLPFVDVPFDFTEVDRRGGPVRLEIVSLKLAHLVSLVFFCGVWWDDRLSSKRLRKANRNPGSTLKRATTAALFSEGE